MAANHCKIAKCVKNCKHEAQDKLHGNGNRVHNPALSKAGTSKTKWRCTVCGAEHEWYMKLELTVDDESKCVYLKFNALEVSRQVEFNFNSHTIVVDVDSFNNVVGIEILNH